eukprot:CAMPEP_0167784582 /NCGR_PEP_ID=MMETSP0111_2-20121227/7720_1 /TAXON_ID=91324 /ORGANISM="Lotharella globosa, Strain CCCM811" /LENGTH=235 /DNA_ID=CAMNT_0007675675 /DNA_START=166 /DNA_END=873 /DNA_ORIENTATION=-
MAYCAVIGCWLWANRAHDLKDRVYGHLRPANLLCEFNCAFQIYDLIVSLLVPTLRHFDRIAHHTVAGILAYWSYKYHLLLYYSIFFFGVSEVSSIFLTFVEFFKEFPSLRDQDLNPFLSQVNEHSRTMFAVLFIAIRVVYWPYVSMQFWFDSLGALTNGGAHPVEITCVLLANIGLTLLQFHWGTIILRQIHKKLCVDRRLPVDQKEGYASIDGTGFPMHSTHKEDTPLMHKMDP